MLETLEIFTATHDVLLYYILLTLMENSGVHSDQSWDTDPTTVPGGEDTSIS